jgi:hypothetical protein
MFVMFDFLRQLWPFILLKRLKLWKNKYILKLLYVINHIIFDFYNFNFLNKTNGQSWCKKLNAINIWRRRKYYVISIFKFYVSFKICNRIKLLCFHKFIVHKLNSKMVNSGIMMLTERKKTDMTDADMVVGWMLLADADCCWIISDREGERKLA